MGNFNKSKKFHVLYKTTNLLNNQYYIGIHSTNNLNDGYLGSGKRLKYSIRKYGTENFELEILEQFNSRKNLIQREIDIVNDDLLKDDMCINLKLGGSGGFSKESWKLGAKKMNEIVWCDPEYRKRHSQRVSEMFKRLNKEGKLKPYDWTGRKHSEKTKEKMRKSKNIGLLNSQYGSRWITNEVINKKIKSNDPIPKGWRFGRVKN